MRTAVQDVLEGNWEHVRLLGSGEVGNVSVERNALLSSSGLCDGQTDTEDSIGSEFGLVGGTVKLVEEVVDLGLFGDADAFLDDGGPNDIVDVLDGLQDT